MLGNTEIGQTVMVDTGTVVLEGIMAVPESAAGVVVFVHGSGSSRLSPRNQYVAAELQRGGLGTLLFDLLTPREEEIDERTGHLRFDIPFLSERAVGTVDWLTRSPEAKGLSIGAFGASTGAAAALIAAAQRPDNVRAVVSRGGRPDLAMDALPDVKAPTLLIVGELDTPVIDMNREAMQQMSGDLAVELRIVPGATHLFEEPGALEEVAELAREWFHRFLPNASQPR